MADSMLSPESVQKMKVADLKKELKERGLPVSGSKAELAERLLKGIQDTSTGSGGDISLGEENISLEEHEEDLVLKEAEKKDEPDEPPKKKIALIAPVKMKPEPITSPTSDVEKAKSGLSEEERIKKRAERFGSQSEQTKQQLRAERFGIQSSNKPGAPAAKSGKIEKTALTPDDLEKLKKRADRFGTNVSSAMTKLEEDERIKKRKERFGAMVSSAPVSAKTGTNSISVPAVDEKKRKRAERFGIQ